MVQWSWVRSPLFLSIQINCKPTGASNLTQLNTSPWPTTGTSPVQNNSTPAWPSMGISPNSGVSAAVPSTSSTMSSKIDSAFGFAMNSSTGMKIILEITKSLDLKNLEILHKYF